MRLHALQYLRALAALLVVYSHACIQVPAYQAQLVEFGSFGVDIFFVISGFIMMYISKPSHTPKAFIINRIRRVVPLYWFFTLLLAAILFIRPSIFSNTTLQFDILMQSLLFVPHFSQTHPGEVWPLLAPGWSLIYEMYFYALFALSLFAMQKYRLPLISTIIFVLFALANLTGIDGPTGPLTEFFKDQVVFEFIFGMLLAFAWQRGFRLTNLAGTAMAITSFAYLVFHSQQRGIASVEEPQHLLTNGIPAATMVTGMLYMKLPENKIGLLLGDASYALYLSHIFVLGLLRVILVPILGASQSAALLFVGISVVACTLISIPVHLLIDNWLLRQERFDLLRPVKQHEA